MSLSLVGEDTQLESRFTYQWASGFFVPVLAVILALIVGGIIVAVAGQSPFTAYRQLFGGAFGSPYNITETVVTSIPLMLTGLAVAFSFRAGLFNIGAEGQLFVGAVCSAFVGYKLNLPGFILIPIALIAGALGGAFWAGIAGVLKAWRGAHEVITTMMLNYTAVYVSTYLLSSTPTGRAGPMQMSGSSGNPETPPMHAQLPIIIPNTWVQDGRLHAGLLVALGAGVLFWFILWRTTLGYKIRAVGLNPKAAAFAGINVGLITVVSMLIAGSFAGLGGMVNIFGLYPYTLTSNFSPGYGFDAIAVALLGRNTVFGTIFAALLFGSFVHGGQQMQATANISVNLVQIVQGLIIFFVGADAIIRYLTDKGLVRLPQWQKRGASAA